MGARSKSSFNGTIVVGAAGAGSDGTGREAKAGRDFDAGSRTTADGAVNACLTKSG